MVAVRPDKVMFQRDIFDPVAKSVRDMLRLYQAAVPAFSSMVDRLPE